MRIKQCPDKIFEDEGAKKFSFGGKKKKKAFLWKTNI